MKVLILILSIAAVAYSEQFGGLLNPLSTDALTDFREKDSKTVKLEDEGSSHQMMLGGTNKFSVKPVVIGLPISPTGKKLKMKAMVPLKKVAVKKAVKKKLLAAPKIKAGLILKSKPKVYSLKPIVHVIEKPVPVYHKVPVPKKVIIPKFYPVPKFIPVPKIIPVPFKVPVKKIIPKIVKIPKAIPVPKFIPVKKPVPIPIPYPVAKYHRIPIPKPVPYIKYIPIPIPKKVPKFIPVPIKKIIKVPKPYYVPIKVPHFTTSYVKTPMVVDVPDVKKVYSGGKDGAFKKPKSSGDEMKKFMESMNSGEGESMESLSGLGEEDKELLKMLSGSMSGGENVRLFF